MTTQVTTNTDIQEKQRITFLTKVLRADGVFALLSGFLLLVGRQIIADLIELESPIFLAVDGLVFMAYGLMLLYFAGRGSNSRRIGQIAIVLNLLFVAGVYAGLLLNLFPVSTTGKWVFALVAEVVLIFAVLEYIGLRRLNKERISEYKLNKNR